MVNFGFGGGPALNIILPAQGGGGQFLEPWIIVATHQSNMTSGQTVANGAVLTTEDDPVPNLKQVSLNGGGAYPAQFPAFALVEDDARGNLRYPVNNYATWQGVGPAFNYAKAIQTAGNGRKVILIPGGVGGTSMNEYNTDSGTPSGWPKNRYNLIKDALIAAQALNPTAVVHSFISSFLENEMANNMGAANVLSFITRYISDFRLLPGCADAPFVFSSPLPEWMSNDMTKHLYLLNAAKAAVSLTKMGFKRRGRGNAVTVDIIHATNPGNRQEGTEMAALKPLADALQVTPPSAPGLVLPTDSDVMQITVPPEGAMYYDIFARSPAGSGSYSKYEMVPFERGNPGDVLKMPIPGVGGREAYVIAKSKAGDSPASPVRTFAVPAVSVPTPIMQQAFTDADGSDNLITVPSIGSDTTAWIPQSGANTGAAALIKRTLVGGAYGIIMDNAAKNIFRDAYAFPAGDYTIVAAVQVNSGMLNGVLVGAGGATTDINFSGANSGVNIRLNHNVNAVQKLTTSNLFANNFNYWAFIALTYNRAGNNPILMMNDDVLTFPGTLTQRSASPGTTGGVKVYSGFSNGQIALPMRVYNAELNFSQLAKIKDEYKQAHGVTFGVLPAIAA